MLKRILVFVFIIANYCQGQGLNNAYKIDQTDIKNSFDLLGIHPFKFPLTKQTKRYAINYIVEEYTDSVLVNTIDFSKTLSKLPKELAAHAFASTWAKDPWLRLYWFDKSDSKIQLKLAADEMEQLLEFDFNTNLYGNTNYRAFDFKGFSINKKVPIVVRYSNKKGGDFMHCPLDAAPSTIPKMYSKVYIVYVHLLDLGLK